MNTGKDGRWVEVLVAWDEQVLAVRHLSVAELEAGRCFWIGDGSTKCDFVVAAELGVRRFALVSAVLGVPHVRTPERAKAFDAPQATTTWADGSAIPLSAEQKTRVELGALTFHVRLISAEEAPRGAFTPRIDRSAFASFATTFGVAGALFGALAFATPPLWASEDEDAKRDRLLTIQQYLDAAALREEKLEQRESGESESASNGSVTTPTPEAPEKPSAGTASGPKRSDKPGPSRSELLAEARTGGMIALLNDMPAGMLSEFGRTPSVAGAETFADASMFSGGLGETAGFGTLGVGDGSGGPGGTGWGISGIGDGLSGPGGPGGGGWGKRGTGLLPGGHKTKGPTMRVPTVTVGGRMPPEVIQRVVRQNHGRMRLCYEQGLARNPNLEGRVEVRFLIGSDGRVGSAALGSSTMPDSAVSSCVVSAFYSISFPSPDAGTVRVTYPISFTPG